MVDVTNPKTQMVGIAAWGLAMLVTLAVYVGGVADQLEFANNAVCLLYVENYHKDDKLNTWIFDSFSPSCAANVTAGSIAFILLFLILICRGYFYYKSEEPSRNVILVLAVLATVWCFVSFIMACIFSSGLSQTCAEFQKSNKSCGAVFGAGFFESNSKAVFFKNINTINAALGASWVTFIGFGLYAAFEWYQWKNSSLKWW